MVFLNIYPRTTEITFSVGIVSNFQIYNPRQKFVNKSTKLGKKGFWMECFTADFLQDFNENVKIWLLGSRLGTRHQIQAFQGFS